ncbi:hypothetical protein [Janthinobacterium sp. RA13]|uniref:hypothetical protein n=1 Tax=Janthinobacterium sp. RA13 TaxID=1502762 RepID=UPI001376E6D0|nr:hypothetical protein [Janthinobacterium sp. RA13]
MDFFKRRAALRGCSVTGDRLDANNSANKKANPKVGFLLCTAEFLVARGGIEPPTQGFSRQCPN